ncbi:hypothetical protein AWW67_13275 [Roseivirga seohaensis]|jgi:chromosome condensin MukBEF complex kleisin-like MukF subunit|uniref:Uncharacterized protein n=1 Tax=Roseivirga seohaensis TaxID=1914963 RepID=A0A150XKU5_9BACT|nr:hypothetical protein [Roseivirga seohaensis]KYG79340.1 hypothetical protein AWW67_13275 [Roseivirga seohaensis]|tara:strand:+ start:223 stop:624 length:402 start_codon:yes stop_codon:yes gene_type:complete
MKPLQELDNVTRAHLLHQLFPSQMPRFLEFAEDLGITTLERKEQLAKTWDNSFISLELWIGFARHTAHTIQRYGKKLHKSPRLFADQLFDGLNACFMSHCLYQFTHVRESTDPKFKQAVQLLFVYQSSEEKGK